MEYIFIGKIVNTHGIKGELRILSNFKFKKQVFNIKNKLYIGDDKTEEVINSYRIHKEFDMITFKNYNNINEVLKYKGLKVYIDKNSIKTDDYFDEDLIDLEAYVNNKYVGKVIRIEYVKNNSLIVILNNNKQNYIPNDKEFIESIDLDNKKLYIKYIEGLIE